MKKGNAGKAFPFLGGRRKGQRAFANYIQAQKSRHGSAGFGVLKLSVWELCADRSLRKRLPRIRRAVQQTVRRDDKTARGVRSFSGISQLPNYRTLGVRMCRQTLLYLLPCGRYTDNKMYLFVSAFHQKIFAVTAAYCWISARNVVKLHFPLEMRVKMWYNHSIPWAPDFRLQGACSPKQVVVFAALQPPAVFYFSQRTD